MFDAEEIGVAELHAVVLGGHCRLTLRSKRTNVHRTYEVLVEPKKRNGDTAHLVRVLHGQDNTADDAYVRMGVIFERRYYYNGEAFKHPWQGTPGIDSVAHKAFSYFWKHLVQHHVPDQLEVLLARQCTRCGLWLTAPESVRAGLGPRCREAVA